MPDRPLVILRNGVRVPEPIMAVLRGEFSSLTIRDAAGYGFPPTSDATCGCESCRMGRRVDELLRYPELIPEEHMAATRRRLSEVPPVTLGDLPRLSDEDIAEFSRTMMGPEVTIAPGALRSNPASPIPPDLPSEPSTPEPIVNTTTNKPLATDLCPFDAAIFKFCRDLSARLERRNGYNNVRYYVQPDFHKARGYVRIALFECGSSGTLEASQYECASFGYIDRLTGNSMSNIGREARGNVSDPRLVECFTHYGFVPSPVITAALNPAAATPAT